MLEHNTAPPGRCACRSRSPGWSRDTPRRQAGRRRQGFLLNEALQAVRDLQFGETYINHG
jgi:hypothetical protein